MKGTLTLSEREQARLVVLNRVLVHELDVREASRILGVSERHAWRILAAYRKVHAAALAHGNRGRRPVNAVSEEIKAAVVGLALTRYQGFNHTHFAEVLGEREGIVLSRSTVRNILTRAGISSQRHRRPPRHRVRRERLPQEGMLLQIDGSNHDWLQGRGPRLTLLLAVDDATGTFPGALFRKEEDAVGYFLLVRGIIERKGIPLALYSDRHATFRPTRAPVGSTAELTQFGRAMGELGVSQIFALSPEAKGRIERANQTFQDRLVAELHLAGASTEAEANQVLGEFLPQVNQRFGVPAAQPGSAYRHVGQDLDLNGVLCFKHQRKVAKDNTVKFQWRTLQLLPGTERPTYAGVQMEVQVRLDGSLITRYDGRVVPSREAPPRASALRGRLLLTGGMTLVPEVLGSRVEPGAATSERLPAAAPSRPRGARRSDALGPPDVQHKSKQEARWEAARAAKQRGLSYRAIARELGVDHHTAKKYADANLLPPFRKTSARMPSEGLDEGAELMGLEMIGLRPGPRNHEAASVMALASS
ncbi:MAG: ISNCY family transposase [Chloroflexi bacterium]|nr:ISNCY family transposase [Chloroflexota bacterium]